MPDLGPILNAITPRLAGVKYLTLIDASSGYHNLKLDKQSLYLTTFLFHLAGTDTYDCHLEWHQWVTHSRRRKIHFLVECFNVLGIADDISVVGSVVLGRDHNVTLDKVLRICRQANLKSNKNKYLCRCTRISLVK